MFRPKNLLPDPERFLEERLGFGVIVQILVKHGEFVEARGGVGMFRPKNLLPNSERSFRNRDRLLIFSLLKQTVYLLVQCVWIIVFRQRCRASENPEAEC